jgi:hypothetical protein
VKLPQFSKFPRFSRRAPAPRPAFVWRWVYPVVLVGLIVAAAFLADAGLENAMNIRSGKVTRVETDPCKPGFLAAVDTTPTMLVIETDARNDAVGVTAMSLGAGNKGGWVLQIPVETHLKDGKLLWQVWREAAWPPPPTTTRGTGQASTTTTAPTVTAEGVTAGKAAMAAAVGRLLGFSFPSDVIVLPTKTMATLMTAAMPISFTLQTSVQAEGATGLETLFRAGVISIQKETDVVRLFETVGPDGPQARLKRQIDLWSTWLKALEASPTALAAFKSESASLVTYVNALATGGSEYRSLPIADEVHYLGLFIIEPNAAQTVVLAAQMAPFPVMIEPGARLRTALFNGTADCDLTLSAATRFVENGAQIDVLGNATTLDVARSEVVYYDGELKARVEAFARSLGIDAVPRLLAGESAVDMTVTLGGDFKA